MNALEFSDGNYWSVKTQLGYMCKFQHQGSFGYLCDIKIPCQSRESHNGPLTICEVSISVGVVALTLFFSHSGFSRATIHYLYMRGITVFAVRTGMYRKLLDNPQISSKHLFNRAIEVTEKLKKGEADARRQARREKHVAEEKDRQNLARGEGSSSATTTSEDKATMRKPIFPRPPLRRSLPHHMGSMNAQNDVELGRIGR